MMAKEPVVITLAPAETIAIAVEGHTWNDNQIKTARVWLVLRFQNIEVAHGKACVSAILHRDDVVADHSGQNDGLAQMPFFQK